MSDSSLKRVERYASFGGWQEVWEHTSSSTSTTMRFGIYLPPQAEHGPCPVVYWLSGLTCTEQNFTTKAGAQRTASERGVILVMPDTSPRGDDVPNAEGYDLGQGAGFYIEATQEPWARHYHMYTYIVDELPALIEAHFPANDRRSITGHSMGGHGALIIALKNPGRYQSVSAFSPIVAPCDVPWGQKAFQAYLGEDREAWTAWDACQLVPQASERLELFIDQGLDDSFLEKQLQPQRLVEACEHAGHPIRLRTHEGYDHSYYFIASFIRDHLEYHADALFKA